MYKSPLETTHVQIAQSIAEDAINIVHSEFSFSYCEISDTFSDAFDADFTQGEISNCSFLNIGGDAVDTSGSEISLVDSSFYHIQDKAISAGENSQLTAQNLTIHDVGIGIASKDLSAVSIINSTITSAKVTGLAAYIKKAQFGPAEIHASQVEILETKMASMVQTGSTITIDGIMQPSEDFDVELLYDLNVLGN